MKFDEALKAMRMGNKVAREAWRGRISYWFIFERRVGDPQLYQMNPKYRKHRIIRMNSEDILATDWWIVA